MYREVAKLIIYGNHEDTILMKMSDIFQKNLIGMRRLLTSL